MIAHRSNPSMVPGSRRFFRTGMMPLSALMWLAVVGVGVSAAVALDPPWLILGWVFAGCALLAVVWAATGLLLASIWADEEFFYEKSWPMARTRIIARSDVAAFFHEPCTSKVVWMMLFRRGDWPNLEEVCVRTKQGREIGLASTFGSSRQIRRLVLALNESLEYRPGSGS